MKMLRPKQNVFYYQIEIANEETVHTSSMMETNVQTTPIHQLTTEPTKHLPDTTEPIRPLQFHTPPLLSKPIPVRPVASRVVLIQSPKNSEFTQPSKGQLMLAPKPPPSIIIPSPNTSTKQLLVGQKNLIPVTSANKFAYLSKIVKTTKPNETNPIVTHLSVVPAPTNQKIVFKSIKPSQTGLNTLQRTESPVPSAGVYLPIKPPSIIKPKSFFKITNGQIQGEKGGFTLLKDNLGAKIPPLQPITIPAPTVTTNSASAPVCSEKESEKEYTLSIPEGNSNYMDADSSIELMIKENSTDTVEVTCTISKNKDKTCTSISPSKPPEDDTPKKHEIAILKRPRLQDTDWKKSRTDFASILEPKKDDIKIMPLNLEVKKKEIKEPEPKKEEIPPPEVVKTIVTERRRKSNNTILKDSDEITFTMFPEEVPQSKSIPIASKKVSIRKELATKSKLDVDDMQIEVIKKEMPPVELFSEDDFDPIKVLDWNDGIGHLRGSDLKFYMNEWGFMQMVTDHDIDRIKATRNDNFTKPEKKLDMVTCVVCDTSGLKVDFFSNSFCTYSCAEKKAKDDLKRRKEKKQLSSSVFNRTKSKTDLDTATSIKSELCSSNGTPAHSDDENTSNDATQPRSTYPWLTGKKGFSWAKYLSHINGKAAPVKLFKDPFPYTKNGFKVGMKLEGIDPQRPSNYCVLTVAEVLGYRIRLHFDGYLDRHDFWQNADSLNIFPVGWCDKNNHKLHPPKGYTFNSFNWTTYLKNCKAQAAPRPLFLNRPENSPCPNGFRLGMKLEAVDRTDSSLICVATVADIMDNRILVHFDSWDDIYDYWADPTSPYIHPVGWCETNGHSLTPPYKLSYKLPNVSHDIKSSFKDPDTFTWDAYLKDTKSQAAPVRAFKQRPIKDFKRGMRIESVDKRIPRFIRVATVDDVRDHQIRVSFDGWLDKYSYWIDDDSPDIHPVSWCQKTGHPIQPPLTPEDIYSSECTTPGCRGWGNTSEPHLETHGAPSDCPYSDENFDKEHVPDRLQGEFKDQKPNEAVPLSKEPKRLQETIISIPPTIRTTKRNKNCDNNNSDDECDSSSSTEKPKIKKRKYSSDHHSEQQQHTSNSYVSSKMNILSEPELLRTVTQDNYDPITMSDPDKLTPFRWDLHSRNLSSYVDIDKDPRTWTENEVVDFISTIPSCKDLGLVFSKHQIDGEALLMLSQNDLTSTLGFKLGPAIKLYNSIVLLRRSVLMYC